MHALHILVLTAASLPHLIHGYCGDVPSGLNRQEPIDIYQEINRWRAKLVFGRQLNGNPSDETTRPLYPGLFMYKLKFDCDFQMEAILALDKCPKGMPNVPAGKTGFYYDGGPAEGVKSWLEEMHTNEVNATASRERLKYQGINRNYFNLVRANTSRIGCAARRYGAKRFFCLTNNKPLAVGQTVYKYSPTDNGGCPVNKCPGRSTCAYDDSRLCVKDY